jgi:hypothetical protein
MTLVQVRRQRGMLVRLFSGGWLGVDGQPTKARSQAVQLRPEDAQEFLVAMRTREHADPLHAASLELLPKRGATAVLSPEVFRTFLVSMQTVRLGWDADRCDRLAASYLAEARHAETMAATMRAKAAELRASLTK